MKEDNAQVSLEAVILGISSFKAYAEQLSDFDKKTREAVDVLGQTHQDQNYKFFCDFFVPVWAKVDIFKKEVEEFQKYLEVEKKYLEEYIEAGKKRII